MIVERKYFFLNYCKDRKKFFKFLEKIFSIYKIDGFKGIVTRFKKKYAKLKVKKGNIKFDANYKEWINHCEKISCFYDVSLLRKKPLISIIMPVYNSEPIFLKKAIDSVLEQTYPYWELCIADDASSSKETLKVLKEYEKKDKRIKVIYRKQNGHICAASNSALNLAKGEWVTFLDHDDMLSSNALYEIAKAINSNDKAKLIYSDEDKIDENDSRFEPYFKSNWNPDLFFSQNYINHLTALKKEIIDKIKGFKKGVEGSQDYDLILRSLQYINDNEIIHIPKILYHWRSIKGSTALDPNEKSYTTEAGIKALQDYFNIMHPGVVVIEGLLPNTYKPIYPIPGIDIKEQIKPYIEISKKNREIYNNIQYSESNIQNTPLVSLIISTRDKYEVLKKCIESILNKTNYSNYEIIIVNNQSTDTSTIKYLKHIKEKHDKIITIIEYDKPFNFSAINNLAVKHTKGEIIGLINNDIEFITENWLIEMVQHVVRTEIGAVGAKLYYGNDTIQHAGVVLGIGGVAGHSHKYFSKNHPGYFSRLKIIQNYSAVTAACLLLRKSVYFEVGGLNDTHLKVAFNDVDLCLKIQQKGYRNLWTPYAEAYHYESLSRGKEDNPEKKKRFMGEVIFMKKKWKNTLYNDSYYNPNLTLIREDFSIKDKNECLR
ncbi:glycosyltransferase family 2 protein [Hydrogenimonas thermophila]|uniref:glycosyltransferase family 2 protein n=1 Tax=Hydrogenimonas thermophila TaxID=223786 RepID=UPI002937237B|nr:glycosyltransferase family 2 protein [Hydrogenimonas thermophila]WOE69441.1 glycosyltransferase family 2 protein [Hydrogenimonas thermophila]WOE71951.1 glycosyltransferase family 2 protein [Hydrogenimonas thermophila]